jgi:hypothetical protein
MMLLLMIAMFLLILVLCEFNLQNSKREKVHIKNILDQKMK